MHPSTSQPVVFIETSASASVSPLYKTQHNYTTKPSKLEIEPQKSSKISLVELWELCFCGNIISTYMSWRHVKVTQGMKDQASKCDTVKSLRDSACSSSSAKQARLFSSASDSSAFRAAKNEKLKQAEESLRTIMYLSCWGPN